MIGKKEDFLKTLVTKTPFLSSSPTTIENQTVTTEFCFEDQIISPENPDNQICGLGAAYLFESLAVSLLSHEKWDKNQLLLQKRQLDEDGNISDWENISIYHASQVQHIEENRVNNLKLIAKTFDWDHWNPKERLLPLTNLSNTLIKYNTWCEWFTNEVQKQRDAKLAIIRTMARNVAEINGYQYNEQISAKNQTKNHLRDIYETRQKKHKRYLSTDFETGGFEVCDSQGQHLGEYNFEGQQTQVADTKGKHNIKL